MSINQQRPLGRFAHRNADGGPLPQNGSLDRRASNGLPRLIGAIRASLKADRVRSVAL
jgi:hypothetical protein